VASLDIVDTLQLLLEISAGKREYVPQTFKGAATQVKIGSNVYSIKSITPEPDATESALANAMFRSLPPEIGRPVRLLSRL